MNIFLSKYKLQVIFTLAGGLSGYLYWKYVGCISGSCPIKSVWYWSMLWGASAGYLTGDILDGLAKWIRKKRSNHE